jgi:hypothetical protein
VTKLLVFGVMVLGPMVSPGGRDFSVVEARVDGKTGAEARRMTQERLAICRPASSLPPQSVPACLQASGSVSGYWVGSGDPGDCLRVTELSTGEYSVAYLTRNRDSTLRFLRAGRLRGNVLTFGGPVMDSNDVCVEQLYAFSNGNQRSLVPDYSVREVRIIAEMKGCSALTPDRIGGNTFIPADAKAESLCRNALGAAPHR